METEAKVNNDQKIIKITEYEETYNFKKGKWGRRKKVFEKYVLANEIPIKKFDLGMNEDEARERVRSFFRWVNKSREMFKNNYLNN